jgi:hypothetical protein
VRGLSSLLNCTDSDYVVKPTSPHFDDHRYQGGTSAVPSQMDTASRPRTSDDDPDAFLDRWATLNIEMDEDAKYIGPKPLTTLPVNLQFLGNPGTLAEGQKICMNHIHSTTATCGQASWIIGKKHGNSGRDVL